MVVAFPLEICLANGHIVPFVPITSDELYLDAGSKYFIEQSGISTIVPEMFQLHFPSISSIVYVELVSSFHSFLGTKGPRLEEETLQNEALLTASDSSINALVYTNGLFFVNENPIKSSAGISFMSIMYSTSFVSLC